MVTARDYVRRRRRWAQGRLSLTHDLVEKMTGQRTRQVQEPPERWHIGEDERLADYGRLGRDMDRRLCALLALTPRGWVVVALAALGVVVAGDGSAGTVAVGAGGILLGLLALTRLVAGMAQLSDAVVAWGQVAPLIDAAARRPPPALPPTHRRPKQSCSTPPTSPTAPQGGLAVVGRHAARLDGRPHHQAVDARACVVDVGAGFLGDLAAHLSISSSTFDGHRVEAG